MKRARLRELLTTLAWATGLALVAGVLTWWGTTCQYDRSAGRRTEPLYGADTLEASRAATHRVLRVYDGDTIEVAGVGKVRLIGIDAMDGYKEEKTARQARRYGMSAEQVRRWAERATAFARERLEDRDVLLRRGPELRDDYGRTLAYVELPVEGEGEDADFNLMMIRRGLAAAYRASSHPRRADYLAAETQAREEHEGFWKDARYGR